MDFSGDVSHNGVGYGIPVECTGTTAEFVKDGERPSCGELKDVLCLLHFNEEGRFALKDAVRGPDTREHTIYWCQFTRLGRDETTYLREDHGQSGLAEKSRFTTHVRTCHEKELLIITRV